jgi:tripartite-type tricarboxylate transporter receptor subunit TctC
MGNREDITTGGFAGLRRREWCRQIAAFAAMAATAVASQWPRIGAASDSEGSPNAGSAGTSGTAGNWPTRPITLVVPWPAGGPTDLSMRVLARVAGRELGVPVVVENKPGAGGVIALGTLLTSPHDGYTIMQLPITVYRLPYQQHLTFDPARDIAPILQVSAVTFGVVVNHESRFRSLGEILSFGRSNPGKLVVGSTGYASTPHLVMADLFDREGIDYIHVPFKGASDELLALQSDTIMVGVVGSGYAPLVDKGQLRLLATFNEERSPRWPDTPTLKELGYGIATTSPYGLGAAKGTPTAIIRRLHDAFRTATLDPEHVAMLRRYDQDVAYLDTAAFSTYLAQAIELEERWSRYIRPNR